MGNYRKQVTVGELALIAITRAALGAGIALLVADRLGKDKRIAAGWALAAIGGITTVPLLVDVFGKQTRDE